MQFNILENWLQYFYTFAGKTVLGIGSAHNKGDRRKGIAQIILIFRTFSQMKLSLIYIHLWS